MNDTVRSGRGRDLGIDLAKAFCAIGIVMYHYDGASPSPFKLFYTHANGFWGVALVTVFFMASGYLLRSRYPTVPPRSLGGFYRKRWLSIFPPFYLLYAFYFVENVISHKKLFYNGNPLRLILSVIGMDGYLAYKYPTYYIIGEWFLGAIILCYLLYPLLQLYLEKTRIFGVLGMAVLALLGICVFPFSIPDARDLFFCLFRFLLGMYIAANPRCLKNNILLTVLACAAAVIVFVPLPIAINETVCSGIVGIALFFILVRLGRFAGDHTRVLPGILRYVSTRSYCIFLFQHMIISKFLAAFRPQSVLKSYLGLLIVTVLVLLYSEALYIVSNEITGRMAALRERRAARRSAADSGRTND